MSEGKIRCMVSAEATACHHHFPHSGLQADTLDDVMTDHFIVGIMRHDPVMGMCLLVIKAILVLAIGTKHLDQALFDVPGGGANQPHIPIFMKRPHRSGEEDYWITCMAEYQHLHISHQVMGVPFKIFFFHSVSIGLRIKNKRLFSKSKSF
ncbi:hypothetical protein [Nitritalea halalkaliphila]|uniref:hypothetical protein n=1 Tax=Nitritalea halalkaliphila TaxID=590849 RepID=UPI002934C994|nr:hypothetical protein [Nitritalea halalkaliphila]